MRIPLPPDLASAEASSVARAKPSRLAFLGSHFRQPTQLQTLWVAAFAIWSSALLGALFPYWHWHHHPWAETAIHAAMYLPVCFVVTYLGLGFFQQAHAHRQESKNVGYIGRLDHLRFFAAGLVIMYHYYHGFVPMGQVSANPLLNLCSEGSSGVDLFFVLSGFIFAVIAYGNRIRYFDYLFSRVVRIYPLYLFGVVLVVGVHQSDFSPLDFLLLLFPVVDIGRMPGLPGFGQLWSVGLEFQFYLIFPFLAAFILRNGHKYLLGLLALTIGLRLLYFTELGTVRDIGQWTLLGRMDEFIAGMLASWVYVNRRSLFGNPLHLVASVALMLGCMQWLVHWGGYHHGANSPLWIVWPTIEGAFWAYLVLSYLSCRISMPRTLDATLAGLGQLSFSLYVMHSFALYWAQKQVGVPTLTGNHDVDAALAAILVCIPLSVVISLFTYNLIEKQFFVFRRRYIVPAETPAGVAATAAANS